MRGYEAAECEYYGKLDSCRDNNSECLPEIYGFRKDRSPIYSCNNCYNEKCIYWEEHNTEVEK